MENPFDHRQDQYSPRQNQSGSPWSANNPNNTGAPPPPPRPPSNPAPNNRGAYSQGSYTPYSTEGAGYGYNSGYDNPYGGYYDQPAYDNPNSLFTFTSQVVSNQPVDQNPNPFLTPGGQHSSLYNDTPTFSSSTPGHGGDTIAHRRRLAAQANWVC
ncbi:SubName: Full=Uncharacterized protein {ECO:0000313/EMBL:CCA76850.1} [Serendipita indica DSM 11827]|uniref:Uncharacterized protein n=1 Tax=Serendipita indica (strain DSM 11827) TaxID=1109443 RepID=G4TZV7_SERID|nr:SubName: Full=Uncharacterized protein {ECO:0000313/EMBL:CCA76850.1} [Serendipita indica DSM 11827]CCA76850.1 hypothetical protein PIIN_10835 [Serendipita indica DSM 11827]